MYYRFMIACLLLALFTCALPLGAQNKQVVVGEYFWDTDPGEGNGTPLTATDGNFNEAIEDVLLTTTLPAAGIHRLSIRVKDIQNKWGPLFSLAIDILPTSTPTRSVQVTTAEYFWDADPGQGLGTTMLAFDGNFNEAIEAATTSMNNLPSVGIHKFNMRVLGADNVWGPVFSTIVDIQSATPSAIRPIKVVAAEYYLDADPGQGNGYGILALDGNFNGAIETAIGGPIPSPVVAGLHTLYLRVRDGNNVWGPSFGVTVYIDTTINSFKAQINGPTQLCGLQNFGILYTATARPSHTYAWSITGGIIVAGGNFHSPTVVWNGNAPHRLQLIDCFSGVCDTAAIIVNVNPTIQTSISQTICSGQSYLGFTQSGTYINTYTGSNGCDSVRTLLLTVLPNISTTVNATICTGQAYQGYTSSGTYTNTYTAANGCDSTRVLNLTVTPTLTQTINQTVCFGGSYLGYSTTGTYRDTFVTAAGCDSIRTLNLTIRPQNRTTVSATICQGQNYYGYTFGGTYVDQLIDQYGCDSVRTLNLTVTQGPQVSQSQTICFGSSYMGYTTSGTYQTTRPAPTGCDTVVTLTLTVRPQNNTTINANVCFGQTYQGYTASGTYINTYTDRFGCDSTRTLNLTVRPRNTSNVSISICPGQNYHGYTSTGVYTDVFTDQYGCDSTRTLNLTVSGVITNTISQTVCFGNSYLGYTSTGTYRDTFNLPSGCDSIRVLNLTVRPRNIVTINQTICFGQAYLGYNVSGTYSDNFIDQYGCDSTRTLVLTVRPQNTRTINISICPGQNYQGYTTAGTYTNVFTDQYGCDSTRILNLTLLSTSSGSITQSICQGQSYFFNGVNRSAGGTYLDTLVNAAGCDSFLTLTLTIKPRTSGSFSQSICAGQSYLFNGVNRTIAGTYLDTLVNAAGCDSFLTLNLTVKANTTGSFNQSICAGQSYFFNGINRTVSGTYLDTLVNAAGCDSFLTLNLTVKPATTGSLNASICPGATFLFNGINRTSAGAYLDTLVNAAGCDSILTLNLTVKATSTGSFSASICPGGSYLFNGINRTVAGAYLDTLVNAVGCDSFLTLNLNMAQPTTGIINESICTGGSYLFNGILRTSAGIYLDTLVNVAGCDSFLTLNLSINSFATGTINASICAGDSYLFNGINLTTAGAYRDTLVAVSGCDSILTLNLTVKATSTGTINASICSGSAYLFNGINRTVAGTYLDTLVNSIGCDSILTLNLTIKATSTGTINASICSGSAYLFNGINLTVAGTYLDTLVNSVGCDSILTLNLTIKATSNSTINESICSSGAYLFNGINLTVAGTYLDTLVNGVGCDSIVTLNLSVNSFVTGTASATICAGASYIFNNQTLTTSGSYNDTLTASSGCDSIVTLTLNVRTSNIQTVVQNICQGQNFEGYTATGSYVDTFADANGCDSIRTLNLTVSPAITFTETATICAGEVLNGHTVTGIYRDTIAMSGGCDSIHILDLTVEPLPTAPAITAVDNILSVDDTFATFQWYLDGNLVIGETSDTLTASTNGNYTVVVTNSVGCADTSSVFTLTGITVGQISAAWQLQFYPNPTEGDLFVSIKGVDKASWALYNSLGQLLHMGNMEGATTIDLSLYAAGIYHLKVRVGNSVVSRKVIKVLN